MKKLIICAALLLGLASCDSAEPKERINSDNVDITVELMFTHDGCNMYRFQSCKGCHYVYWSDCRGSTETAYTVHHGKTTSTDYTQQITSK